MCQVSGQPVPAKVLRRNESGTLGQREKRLIHPADPWTLQNLKAIFLQKMQQCTPYSQGSGTGAPAFPSHPSRVPHRLRSPPSLSCPKQL